MHPLVAQQDSGSLPGLFQTVALIVILAILAVDLVLAYRRPHVPSTRESAIWVGVYVALALVFAGVLLAVGGSVPAGEFVAGWLTEYALSVDNLFVFLVIIGSFEVPRRYQQEVLMGGILLALLFRGVFILVGAELIERFTWIFYLFGAFLMYTAFTQAFGKESEPGSENAVVRFARKRLPVTERYDGAKMRTTVDGKRMFTPILLVLISLGLTDLLFALDSIPAIFGITSDPFVVFTANVFALMGLRQLYFLLGDLVARLAYLKYGIAFILAFIGVKLVLEAMHDNTLPFINGGEGLPVPEIGTGLSLIVIVASMTVAVLASLVKLRKDPAQPDPNEGAGSDDRG